MTTSKVIRQQRPPKARPRKDMKLDLPASRAFLSLSLDERERRLAENSEIFKSLFSGCSVADFIAEKRQGEDIER